MSAASIEVTIRAAVPSDAATITGHRRAMFAEIRPLLGDKLDAMAAAFEPWVAERLARAEYQGWLAVAADGGVVGGVGVWFMDWPPHMIHVEPQRANILNVFVASSYRRQGLARRLTETALAGCRRRGVAMVILHASEAGRPIYAALGFAPTNEMSLVLNIDPPRAD